MENIRMFRQKRGQDTFFDLNPDMNSKLNKVAKLLEQMLVLDPDFSPPALRETLNLWVSPHKSPWAANAKYAKSQIREWKHFHDAFDAQVAAFKNEFPCKRGLRFHGIPLHLATPDGDSNRGLTSID